MIKRTRIAFDVLYKNDQIKYRKTQECAVFTQNSNFIFIVQITKENEKLFINQTIQGEPAYNLYRKFNFNQYLLDNITFSFQNKQIFILNIQNLRGIQHIDQKLLLTYQNGQNLSNLLVFDQSYYSLVMQTQLYISNSRFSIPFQLELFSEMASIEYQPELHEYILSLVIDNLKVFLDKNYQFDTDLVSGNTLNNEVFRLIGFQSGKPSSDFRSSGFLGAVFLLYFSTFNPQILVQGSFGRKFISQDFIEFFVKGNYFSEDFRYPFAISLINVISKVLTLDLSFLEGQIIKQFQVLMEVKNQLSQVLENRQMLITDDQNDNVLIEYKQSLVTSIQPRFNVGHLKILPLSFIQLNSVTLDGIHPTLCGSIFRLASEICMIIHRQLDDIPDDKVYMSYNSVFADVFNRVKKVLICQDILGIDDFCKRMNDK